MIGGPRQKLEGLFVTSHTTVAQCLSLWAGRIDFEISGGHVNSPEFTRYRDVE